MRRPKLLANLLTAAILTLTLAASAQAHNPERGIWRAQSKSAKSVTGDVAFSDIRVAIDFYNFTIANIRTLTPAELAAAFDTDASTPATGTLYRLVIPGTKKFLHGTLCAAEDTQWIVTFVSGRSLQLLFFSGNDMPVLTPDALPNNPNLCGLYAYTR